MVAIIDYDCCHFLKNLGKSRVSRLFSFQDFSFTKVLRKICLEYAINHLIKAIETMVVNNKKS